MFKCIRNLCCKTNVLVIDVPTNVNIQPEVNASPKKNLSHFVFIKQLGTGATSVVNLLEERGSGDKYVCKTVENNRSYKALREISILKKLKSTYFPKYYCNFYENGKYHILTKYFGDKDLHDILDNEHKRGKILHSQTAESVLIEMAKCLFTLKQSGFSHLDVKPENFIVQSKDPIKLRLIDFGATQVIKPGLAYSSLTVGTRGYSPPEVYKSLYHINSDIWSLGVCFWIILTGYYAFDHKDIRRVRYNQHLYNHNFPTNEFIFPTDEHLALKKHILDKHFNIIEKMLKFDPEERPTIEAVLNEFLFT